MMKNRVASIIAVVYTAAAIAGMVSCSRNDGKKDMISENTVKLSLNASSVELADNFSEIRNLDISDKGTIFIFGQLKTGGWSGYTTDSSFGEFEELRFIPDENEAVMGACLASYGKKAVLTVRDEKTYIHIYSTDGKFEKTLDCGEVIDGSESYARIFSYGTDRYMINCNNSKLAAVDSDGSYMGNIKTEGMKIFGVAKNNEGKICCLLSDMDASYTAEINADSLELADKKECGSLNISAYAICRGTGEYEIAAVFSDGLYGLNEGKWEFISDFMNTSINAYEVSDILMTAENEFVTLSTDSAAPKLSFLTEEAAADLKTKKLVRAATWLDSDNMLIDMVKAYNSANEDGGYRVELVSYEMPGKTMEESMDALKLDIISGNAPDIIPFNSSMPIDTFGSKEDMFVDMYTLLDNDPDYSREDFLPNAIEGLESGGKLLRICPAFEFMSVAAAPVIPDVKENWSTDDMYAAYDTMPGNMKFIAHADSNPRMYYIDVFINPSLFVDYESAECSFDSADFIRLISFLNEKDIGLTPSEMENQASYAQSDAEGTNYLISPAAYGGFQMLHQSVKGKYGDEVIFAGFPSADGNGSYISYSTYEFGILSNSPNVEGAWDFLKSFLSDEYYETVDPWSFPVLKERFDECADMTTRDYTYVNPETGEKVTEKWQYTVDSSTGETIEIDNFTKEECEYYKNLVMSAEYLPQDSEVYQICHEELAYFFDGERSAEETAALIQNRVSIYLSEHYS